MNYETMSEKLQQILMRAVEICKSYGHAMWIRYSC